MRRCIRISGKGRVGERKHLFVRSDSGNICRRRLRCGYNKHLSRRIFVFRSRAKRNRLRGIKGLHHYCRRRKRRSGFGSCGTVFLSGFIRRCYFGCVGRPRRKPLQVFAVQRFGRSRRTRMRYNRMRIQKRGFVVRDGFRNQLFRRHCKRNSRARLRNFRRTHM